jgi:RimJ/RimL family protein N-acetyltransferase
VPASLRTSRLPLRPWRDGDVAPFVEMSADPIVMEYLPPAGESWVDWERAHWDEHGFGQRVAEVPGEASFIGVVGLAVVGYEEHFTPAVEVAWRLAHCYWGRGYATEAARASLDYGFGDLGLDEIVALTVPANWPSRRVMERLGMTRSPEDDFDHPGVPAGPLRRHVLYRSRNPGAAQLRP